MLCKVAARSVFISAALDSTSAAPVRLTKRPLSFFPAFRDPEVEVEVLITDSLFILFPGVPWVLIRNVQLSLSCLEEDNTIQIPELGGALFDWDYSVAFEPAHETESGMVFIVASITQGPVENIIPSPL